MVPRVEYLRIFLLLPVKDGKFVGICKDCGEAKSYGAQSKGNLLKHDQLSHPEGFSEHLEKQDKDKIKPDQCLFDLSSKSLTNYLPFLKQKSIEISIFCDLCAKSRLPVTIVEDEQFRRFMKNVQTAFQTPCFRMNMKNVAEEFANRVISFKHT